MSKCLKGTIKHHVLLPKVTCSLKTREVTRVRRDKSDRLLPYLLNLRENCQRIFKLYASLHDFPHCASDVSVGESSL